MTRSTLLIAGAALCSALAWLPHGAAAADKVERYTVDASTPGTKTLRGKIRGYGTAEYKVLLRQGQDLTVGLKTNSLSNYFNITAPGAQEALFNGSINGLDYRGKVEQDGEYTVNVYLMRNAARRNERASYTLSVGTQP
ncbi:hypothetical protein [Pseudoduganella umbonata]|uniref:DNA breaking-rejoining protein n=1 Tax=Pseudoduganella umbonata TaxID=864828 RepID=A0A4P8HU74_9BURK|nr:hypothetical protein [Pseudoduganella umbonata]MBB3223624.1 hypothetical protein [Pseudoduganella umbonata]QCP13513.1 hypothetical protein FCL38_26035 [Pseudoduganella umbonata]